MLFQKHVCSFTCMWWVWGDYTLSFPPHSFCLVYTGCTCTMITTIENISDELPVFQNWGLSHYLFFKKTSISGYILKNIYKIWPPSLHAFRTGIKRNCITHVPFRTGTDLSSWSPSHQHSTDSVALALRISCHFPWNLTVAFLMVQLRENENNSWIHAFYQKNNNNNKTSVKWRGRGLF